MIRAASLAWLVVGCALVSACAGSKPPPKTSDNVDAAFEAAVAAEKERDNAGTGAKEPAETGEKKGPVYPAPFTWEQIRAATKSGRTYRFKVEVPGKPAKERVLTFTKVDDDGCELYTGNGEPKRMGWPTLQKHAEFPKDRVTTREETVKLPGGKFDCIVYEVKNDGDVSTYYFAKSLPGAPVLFYVEQDGKRIRTTTLIEHVQGKALLP